MAKAVHPYDLLVRPVITEKSTRLAEGGQYVFQVRRGAGKAQVREAVEKAFGVKVTAVNTMNLRGKAKRAGRRGRVVYHPWKKAIVTLVRGQKIDLFEGV